MAVEEEPNGIGFCAKIFSTSIFSGQQMLVSGSFFTKKNKVRVGPQHFSFLNHIAESTYRQPRQLQKDRRS
jgi:hypothetical protein